MTLQSKFFTFFFFIVGFLVVPVLLLLFFFSIRALEPDFWTKAVSASGFVSGVIEEKVANQKKIPVALRSNLHQAKDAIEKSLGNHLEPQIRNQIVAFKEYCNGRVGFPSLRFDLVRLKQDVARNIRTAEEKQKLTDRIVVNTALAALPLAPDYFNVGDYVKLQVVKDFCAKNRMELAFIINYPYLFPCVVVVFFFLFLLSTFHIRTALYYFSNLMIFSGIFLAFICGLGLLFVQLFDPFLKGWLMKNWIFYYDMTNILTSRVASGLTKYLVWTMAIRGLIAAACGFVLGVLCFAKKKKPGAVLVKQG